jgi:HlyD family secretion protein
VKKISKIWILLGIIAIVAIAVWLLSGSKKKEEVTFKTEKVAPANIQNSITATGTIEPVTSVTVGTQVSGIVSKLYVDYNSVVRKGQVIAELDRTNLLSELNTAKANLSSAQSSLNYQQANLNRYSELYKKGLVSADDYEAAQLSYRQSKEQERKESADKSRIRHHHLPYRWRRAVEVG